MSDLDRRIAEEIDDEALFRLAEGDMHDFSPEYQEKMGRLYKKSVAHPKRKLVPLRRIAAVAAILAVLTGTATATFWEDIRQFFVTTFGEYVELRVEPKGDVPEIDFSMIPEDWTNFWFPGKVIDGYSFLSAETLDERKVMTFNNEDHRLQMSQWPAVFFITADREGTAIGEIFVDDCEAYVLEKDVDGVTWRSITWMNDDILFQLYGEFSIDDLVKIGESLVYIEK